MAFRLIVPKPRALLRKLAFGAVLFVARPIEQATIALRRVIADPADEEGCQSLARRRQCCRERDDLQDSPSCSLLDGGRPFRRARFRETRMTASHVRDDVSRSAGRAAAMLNITSSAEVADVAYASAWRSESVRAVSRTCSRQIPSARAAVSKASGRRSGPGRQLGQPAQCIGSIGMLRAELLLLNRQSSSKQWLGVVIVAAVRVNARKIDQRRRHFRMVRTKRLLPDAQGSLVEWPRGDTVAGPRRARRRDWSPRRRLPDDPDRGIFSCEARARSNSGRVRLKSSRLDSTAARFAQAFSRAWIGETAGSLANRHRLLEENQVLGAVAR